MKQYSTITALLSGDLTGTLPVGELLTWGDFGVGAYHHINGEMTVLDGVCYQSLGDGRTIVAENDTTTQFACVTRFQPEIHLPLHPAGNMEELGVQLDRAVEGTGPECIYAVRIEGKFAKVSFRSVDPQEPPFPPLARLMLRAERKHFRETMDGTLVGLCFPTSMEGVNTPGWHLHVLTKDRSLGGHVLDVAILEGEAEIACLRNFHLRLPEPHKNW